MRCKSSLWVVCVATCFLVGCNGSSPPPNTVPVQEITQPVVSQPVVSQPVVGQPGGTIENSIGMKLVLIPTGSFLMDSPASEARRDNDEAQVTVFITSPFSLGVHEVTQSQYESVMGNNPSGFKGANNPVDTVSWDDAVAFCAKLSALPAEKSAGHVYRLPTEAEWEYACRAGTTTAFSFGDDEQDLGKYAWFGRNSGDTTRAVGEKHPNGWGLYDMHGNVWEWCSDAEGSFRVFRGGSWFYNAANCRTAFRGGYHPTFRTFDRGFRLALSSPSGESPEAEQNK